MPKKLYENIEFDARTILLQKFIFELRLLFFQQSIAAVCSLLKRGRSEVKSTLESAVS